MIRNATGRAGVAARRLFPGDAPGSAQRRYYSTVVRYAERGRGAQD